MAKLVVHSRTQQSLHNILAEPPHAIVLVGPAGIGKESIARQLAADLLKLELPTLDNHPFVSVLGTKSEPITIDNVRDVQHFLSRKTTSAGAVNRVALLLDASRLTPEAQNALLKTLEEPPVGSVILMTTDDEQALLPTVLSRVQTVSIAPPKHAQLHEHFAALGHDKPAVERAMLMSGGLPGIMTALLAGDTEHPLVKAAEAARNILRLDTFGRLALVDSLAKQRDLCRDVLFVLQQMAELSLARVTKNVSSHRQWRGVLQEAHAAQQALAASAQPKLVLTHLMLSL